MTGQFWAPKPTELTPYTAPNKPHWKLSEILAAHKGQSDWVQPIVRNKDQVGRLHLDGRRQEDQADDVSG